MEGLYCIHHLQYREENHMTLEKIVIGKNTKYPLKGLLTLPADADTPVPAVVFVHGSGSSNMDEKVGKLTPFKDLAEGLARHGIASVRYDKRSFAHGFRMLMDKSSGPITVKTETVEDAVLATELLRRDPRIDAGNIFIVGHSMGGMLAPRIDAEGGDYRGLVIMAGTPRKLEEVLFEQTDEMLAAMSGLKRKLMTKQMQKLKDTFVGMYDLTDEEAKKTKVGNGTTLYYFKEMGEHAAADYLTVLNKPVLIMQGEKDVQVKADRDFAGYQELLKGRENVTFKLYKGLNHAFVPALYDSIAQVSKEFSTERHIGGDIIADIANWIKAAAAR